MILVAKILLDFEDLGEVYKNIKETQEYLNSVIAVIEQKVLDGEKVNGLYVSTTKSRTITEAGLKYLVAQFGEEKVYKTKVSPIGITDLQKMLTNEQIDELVKMGGIEYKESKPSVKMIEK